MTYGRPIGIILCCIDLLGDEISQIIFFTLHKELKYSIVTVEVMLQSFLPGAFQALAIEVEDADRLSCSAAIRVCHASTMAHAHFST